MPETSPWKKADRWISQFESVVLIVALSGMTLMTFVQVLLRNIFSTSVPWFDPAVRHLLLVAVFLGASLATYERRHIHVDALAKAFRGPWRHLVNVIISVCAGFICGVLLYGGVQFVRSTYLNGDRIHEFFPTWLAQVVMPYAFFMMAVRFLRDAIVEIKKFKHHQPMEPDVLTPAAAMLTETHKHEDQP